MPKSFGLGEHVAKGTTQSKRCGSRVVVFNFHPTSGALDANRVAPDDHRCFGTRLGPAFERCAAHTQ
jgi:hypothetical protein